MKSSVQQQIVVSGVGGQGVLFVTRLLAEAAIAKGLSVLTAETHGMAQRGGTVLSHLKIGDWSSPLIRRGQADVLLALNAETVAGHREFLKPSAWAVINGSGSDDACKGDDFAFVDAQAVAQGLGNPRAVNLIVLGAALGRAEHADNQTPLFCTPDDIRSAVGRHLAEKPVLRDQAMAALDAGCGL